jgi:hypothetical protein
MGNFILLKFPIKKEKKMKKSLSIIFCFLIICCTKNIEKNVLPEERPVFVYDKNFGKETIIYPKVEGSSIRTNVIDDNVNLRNNPSLKGKIIHKLQKDDVIRIIGTSGEKENIDNFYGDWLNITYSNGTDYFDGWVYSKYVNIEEREFAPINFVELKDNKIICSYNLLDKEVFTELYYSETKDFYYFLWGLGATNYYYYNKPGIYSVDKGTLELNHITYCGSHEFEGIEWTKFTNDFRYLIQDSGTNGHPRGIWAWRLEDSTLVYSGLYYKDPYISGNTIEVVCICGDWYLKRGFINEEIMSYGKKYKEENPVPQEMIDAPLNVELIIRCSFDLDTEERKILGGKYILTQ